MKKSFLGILAFTLIFGMAVVGCGDGDDNGNNGGNGNGNNGNEGLQVYNQNGTVFTGNITGTIWYASGFRETERGNNAIAANINITNGKITNFLLPESVNDNLLHSGFLGGPESAKTGVLMITLSSGKNLRLSSGNSTGYYFYSKGSKNNVKIDESFEGSFNITVGWNCLVLSMDGSVVSNSKVNNFNEYEWIIDDNGNNGIGNSGNSNGDVPDLFPSNWQSYTYEEWTEWMENLGNITEQQIEELVNFILTNYELFSEEGKQFWKRVLPEDTHGIDTDNWPRDDDKNGFWTGLYYRKSDDGQALAANPMWRGDGTNAIPDIFILEEGTGGVFPIGTWVNRNDENLIFTSTTVTFDTPYDYDLEQADYSMTSDVFILSNRQTIPYTLNAEDIAKLATFNEANFRNSHPWIPATSTIEAKVKRGEWFYTIADNPTMTPFVSNNNIIGNWLVCDFIRNPNTYDPLNPEWPDANTWEGIQFLSDGTVKYLWDDTWNNRGIWNTTTNTYVGSKITNIITGGIIKEQNGEDAPEFVVKQYAQDLYLFAQWKSGDYTLRALEPYYYVFKKE